LLCYTTCFSDARARYAVLKGRVRRPVPPRGHCGARPEHKARRGGP